MLQKSDVYYAVLYTYVTYVQCSVYLYSYLEQLKSYIFHTLKLNISVLSLFTLWNNMHNDIKGKFFDFSSVLYFGGTGGLMSWNIFKQCIMNNLQYYTYKYILKEKYMNTSNISFTIPYVCTYVQLYLYKNRYTSYKIF